MPITNFVNTGRSMAQPSTLYRFSLELSDIDRALYTAIELRTAAHPSETGAYLITRILAYAHNFQQGLEFSPQGLGDPDSPAIKKLGENGNIKIWIEIGNPSPKRLHKATKASEEVKVYTYKDPRVLIRDLATQYIHKLETISIYSLNSKALERLEGQLQRDNHWSLMIQDGIIQVSVGTVSEPVELHQHFLQNN